MQTLAMIHTGLVVIAPMKELANRHLPDVRIINYLDDRIVADIGDAPQVPDPVKRRLELLGAAAVQAGADAILFTCSSVSQVAADVAASSRLPVYRIDEAMADRAVQSGPRIGVIATLPTTLEPTCALIEERAALASSTITITRRLEREAFELLSAGDGEGHDRVVRGAIRALQEESDVVVLAQASMARALDGLHPTIPVLSSPELGMIRTKEHLTRLADDGRRA